ncbi:Transcription factor T-box [Trinorchestia longiramus]|nr:Transcription factor T-box [Trinorchestia longiramus]
MSKFAVADAIVQNLQPSTDFSIAKLLCDETDCTSRSPSPKKAAHFSDESSHRRYSSAFAKKWTSENIEDVMPFKVDGAESPVRLDQSTSPVQAYNIGKLKLATLKRGLSILQSVVDPEVMDPHQTAPVPIPVLCNKQILLVNSHGKTTFIAPCEKEVDEDIEVPMEPAPFRRKEVDEDIEVSMGPAPFRQKEVDEDIEVSMGPSPFRQKEVNKVVLDAKVSKDFTPVATIPNPKAKVDFRESKRMKLEADGNCVDLEDHSCVLETKELWEKFHEFGTEMIVTKTGR